MVSEENVKEAEINAEPMPVKVAVPSIMKKTKTLNVNDAIYDVIMWQNVNVSMKYLLFAILTAYFTLGPKGYSLTMYLLVSFSLRVIFVYACSELGKLQSESTVTSTLIKAAGKFSNTLKTITPIPNQQEIRFFVQGVSEKMEDKISKLSTLFTKAETDAESMKIVIAHLCAFILAFALFSFKLLLVTSALIVMTLPVLYKKNQTRVDPLIEKLKAFAKPHIENGVQLTRNNLIKVRESVKSKMLKADVEKKND